MRCSAHMTLTLSSEREAEKAYRALEPEVRSDARVRTSLAAERNRLLLRLDASDRTALRAAVSSYGRWMALMKDIWGVC